MRALYTSASGLAAQQTRLDVISNNIANLNTVGYKTKDAQFAELLRSQFGQPDEFQLDGRRSDSGLRTGNGVYAAHLAQVFAQGNLQMTGNMLDLAIDGEGFFAVRVPGPDRNGQPSIAFTRAGKFQIDSSGTIVNDDGYPLLDSNGQPIVIPEPLRGRPLSVAANGDITVQGENGPVRAATINLVLVRNPEANLQAIGNNLYQNSNPDYQPLQDSLSNLQAPEDRQRIGGIRQGALEMSNVDLTQELTELIEAQRAYQLNARSVQTVDAMLGIANNLRA
ncbi:flagellar basal-body rod protein FlgF [Effusibacillus pohliae]|uniref:flagellar basal-body rod protein FlgF n=1 Tax=Effusibacillus pohliae TaxID=232270 RepID=UPI0003650B7B|nr:flagellar basal-body rod protein FlgF [Effusibacillus pohliae]